MAKVNRSSLSNVPNGKNYTKEHYDQDMVVLTTALNLTDDEVKGNKQDADNKHNGLAARVSTAESDISSLKSRTTGTEGRLTSAEGRLSSIETKNTQQDGRLTSLENRETTSENRLTSAEGRLTTAETKNTEQDNRLTSVEGRVTGAESKITSVESRLSAEETKSTEQKTRIDNIVASTGESNIEIVDARYDQVNGKVYNTLKDRMDDQTNQIGSLSDVINACDKYGFVADYQGTPLYDGLDGDRITATDNTAAFAALLDDCIAKKELIVRFPKGHYGIKAGNIVRDLTGCKLTIVGDGMDESIIDFIKEDSTNTSYVDESKANVIARISNFDRITFKDIQIKATTNYNNIGSQIDTAAVYYGAVWGFILDKFNSLRLERVKITKFNYRGISTKTTGANTLASMSKKVIVKDCFFTENKSSGLWCTQLQNLIVDGGEYSYNGQYGKTATGYGITASALVGKATVKNAWFHNNYRKGFDTHGCLSVELDNCRFEDNVLYHFAILGWSMINDITSGEVLVNNCVFSNGLSPESYAWLQDAYNAIIPVSNETFKRGWLWNIDDRKNDRSEQNLLSKVIFTNNKVLCHYNGGDKQANATFTTAMIYAPSAKLTLEGNNINLEKWIANTTVSNSACPLNIGCQEMNLLRNSFIFKSDASFGVGKYGGLFTMQGTDGNQKLTMKQNIFDLNNCYLFVNTSSGDVLDPSFLNNSMRDFQNNIFEWESLQLNALSNRKLFGAVDNPNYPYYFKGNQVKINGVSLTQPEGQFTFSEKNFNITIPSIGAYSPFMEIIIDDTHYFTFEMYLGASGEDLVFKNENIGLTTNTFLQEPVKYGFDSMTRFIDVDGRQKIRLKIATKNNTFAAGTIYGYVKIVGTRYSWGIEKINAIV